MAAIDFSADWAYGVGDVKPNTTNVNDLLAADVNSNVAIDMFLDSDPTKAVSSVDAKYEVMVWLGVFGVATEPIGLRQGALKTQAVNGTTLYVQSDIHSHTEALADCCISNLYFGENGLGQKVLTWVAQGTVQSFHADIGPLLQGLTGLGGPTVNDHLGYLAFGSEALSASTNITFYNPSLSMEIVSV